MIPELADEEWDFSGVLEGVDQKHVDKKSSIQLCLTWEMLREIPLFRRAVDEDSIADFRKTLRRLIRNFLTDPEPIVVNRALEGIPVSLCIWLHKKLIFPLTPWVKLHWRDKREIATFIKIKAAPQIFSKDGEENFIHFGEATEKYLLLVRALAEGNIQQSDDVPGFDKAKRHDPTQYSQNPLLEMMVSSGLIRRQEFALNWLEYTNEELGDAVKTWIKENAPTFAFQGRHAGNDGKADSWLRWLLCWRIHQAAPGKYSKTPLRLKARVTFKSIMGGRAEPIEELAEKFEDLMNRRMSINPSKPIGEE